MKKYHIGGRRYTKGQALGFVAGCDTMIQVFVEAYHKGLSFGDAVHRVGEWKDKELNLWREEVASE